MNKKTKISYTDYLSQLKRPGSSVFNEVIKRKNYILNNIKEENIQNTTLITYKQEKLRGFTKHELPQQKSPH
jgi:hypothetical protein